MLEKNREFAFYFIVDSPPLRKRRRDLFWEYVLFLATHDTPRQKKALCSLCFVKMSKYILAQTKLSDKNFQTT